MPRRSASLFVLFAFLLLIASISARADMIAQTSGYTPGSTLVLNPAGGLPGLDNVVGYSFTVGNNNISATALGMWDPALAGISGDSLPGTLVGLWDSSGSFLASVDIPGSSGGTTSGDFRFLSLLSPVTLTSGQTYTLGFRRDGNTDADHYFRPDDGGNHPTISPSVSIAQGGVNSGNGVVYYLPGYSTQFFNAPVLPFSQQEPTANIGDHSPIMGPNLQFTVIPEPSCLAVVVIAAPFATRRRRRRATFK